MKHQYAAIVCILDLIFFLFLGCKNNLLMCGFHKLSALFKTPKQFIIFTTCREIETLLCVLPFKCNFKHID